MFKKRQNKKTTKNTKMKYFITILLLTLSIFSYSQRMRIVDSLADFKVHVTDNIELADAVICIVVKYTKEECH